MNICICLPESLYYTFETNNIVNQLKKKKSLNITCLKKMEVLTNRTYSRYLKPLEMRAQNSEDN